MNSQHELQLGEARQSQRVAAMHMLSPKSQSFIRLVVFRLRDIRGVKPKEGTESPTDKRKRLQGPKRRDIFRSAAESRKTNIRETCENGAAVPAPSWEFREAGAAVGEVLLTVTGSGNTCLSGGGARPFVTP